MIDIRNISSIHCIGIGGSGMCGLAMNLAAMGKKVSGSDASENGNTAVLRNAGLHISIGHNAAHIPRDCQLVVRSAAIRDDNCELMHAGIAHIPHVKYSQCLGMLMALKDGIAVAGTHGKTTTSSMVAYTLYKANLDPSFIIGGSVPLFDNKGYRVGAGKYFVAEACEYDRSFHNLAMKYAIINNIEEDHLDYYRDIDEIVESFAAFARHIPPDGILCYSKHSTNTARFLQTVDAKKVSYAIDDDADFSAYDLQFHVDGSSFSVKHSRGKCNYRLFVPGKHNVINALAAISLCGTLGVPDSVIADALKNCTTPKRRMEILCNSGGVIIMDDYAHHPTEIVAVLKSLREAKQRARIIAVFQPHQHSRTRFLLNSFAKSFHYADMVIVPDIYFVRDSEVERHLVHAKDLVSKISAENRRALYISSFDAIVDFLASEVRAGDIVVTLGAGDINTVAYRLKDILTR